MDINNTKDLVILECKRIIEILESDTKLVSYGDRTVSELKSKMAELRRDTIRMERQIYRPWEYKNGERV